MTADFETSLREYMQRQRWYAGKSAQTQVEQVDRLPWLSTGEEPQVRIELITVSGDDGRRLVYSVPLAYYEAEQPELDHALVGMLETPEDGRLRAYDALYDRAAIGALVRGFVDQDATVAGSGGLRYRTTGSVELESDIPSVLLTGEQSNTSLVLGEDLLLKLFRTVEPGHNPDIEIHEALTKAGSEAVAPLRGWIETDPAVTGGCHDLAMLQDYLRSGTDGWEYARASVRDLLAEGDLHADEVGGDFAGEAERLGVTVAHLHRDLADVLPTSSWDGEDLSGLASRLRDRLAKAVEQLPAVSEQASALENAYQDVAALSGTVTVQRVHGDLHLGQTLRTIDGWRIIDFEGEPAKPLAERTAPDSPLRDVAGMLRSFDYAAHSVVAPEAADHQQVHRMTEWAARNRAAFSAGYESVGVESQEDNTNSPAAMATLLRAYEIDKALYEAVYEKHNRPSWLPIPMAAIARLADTVSRR